MTNVDKTVNKYRKITCLLLIALVGVSTLTLTLYQREASLRADFEQPQSSYTSLDQSYTKLSTHFEETLTSFQALTSGYITLTGSFSRLQESYSNLTENYVGLQDKYFALDDRYDELKNIYTELNTTYLELQEQYALLNEPLEYVATPTMEEVEAWLEVDDIDASYVEGRFTCGDFTVSLMLHAKDNHWRILFTVIEFDYYAENPNGTISHHGLNAHAFASIFTTEGIIYIEPQTDLVFYLYYGEDSETHVEFPEWVFIDTGPWFGTIFIQYYNRMGLEFSPIRDESPILTNFYQSE